MIKFIHDGGLYFTGPQTVLLLVILGLTARKVIDLYVNIDTPVAAQKKGINAILQIGVFCFFFGVLGQATGILRALHAIEQAADISPAIIFKGFQVSMHSPVYGLGIFLISLIAWSVLKNRLDATVDE